MGSALCHDILEFLREFPPQSESPDRSGKLPGRLCHCVGRFSSWQREIDQMLP